MTSLPERLRRPEPRKLVRTATSSPLRTRFLPSRRSDVSIRLPPRSDRDERLLHGGMGHVETRKTGRDYSSSQERPSVKICTWLPPSAGFTKIVSSASPRFRFSIEEEGVTRSLPFLVQPWILRFAANSAQTLFTLALLLKKTYSTSSWYSMSDASFVRARSLTLSSSSAGSGVSFSLSLVVAGLLVAFS